MFGEWIAAEVVAEPLWDPQRRAHPRLIRTAANSLSRRRPLDRPGTIGQIACRPMTTGMLDPQALETLIRNGSVDTVLVVFTDLQGRLIGKRVTGHFYLDHVASGEGAIEACVYLLAVDVDMTPLPGFDYANWETGYGDFRCVPDPSTLRIIPWLEKTALVLCDLVRRGERRAGRGVTPPDPDQARSNEPRRSATA